MSARKIATVVLLVFVVASVAALVMKNWQKQDGAGGNSDSQPIPQSTTATAAKPGNDAGDVARVPVDLTPKDGPPKQIVAVYFYNDMRCLSCLTIEKWTGEAIQSSFENEIKAQLLKWKTVNTDVPENEHYLKDFDIFTKSDVLVEFQDGKQTRFVNLDKVWDLLRDETKFKEYVAQGVTEFMAGSGGNGDKGA